MGDTLLAIDSLRVYNSTGSAGGADGDANTNQANAKGGHRSGSEFAVLTPTVTDPIANVTVLYAYGSNGAGSGSLRAVTADTLAWTPPGGTEGSPVTIANGETKILPGGGATGKNTALRVSRDSAAALTGTATVALAVTLNNVIAMTDVTSDEATAGEDYYRCFAIKNIRAAGSLSNVKAALHPIAAAVTTNNAQLPASGAGTVGSSTSLASFPASGWAIIRTSGGTLREVVYYSSRTDAALTVPAAGRARLGSSAAAGADTDTAQPIPGARIAIEAPTGDASTGTAQVITDVYTAPTAVTWRKGTSKTDADVASIGTLAITNIYFIWVHHETPAAMESNPALLWPVDLFFDA